jgi:hypothetical protein
VPAPGLMQQHCATESVTLCSYRAEDWRNWILSGVKLGSGVSWLLPCQKNACSYVLFRNHHPVPQISFGQSMSFKSAIDAFVATRWAWIFPEVSGSPLTPLTYLLVHIRHEQTRRWWAGWILHSSCSIIWITRLIIFLNNRICFAIADFLPRIPVSPAKIYWISRFSETSFQ